MIPLPKGTEKSVPTQRLAEMSANHQPLGCFIKQHDAAALQMKIILNNGENLVEDLVEIEGGQHRLTGVVKDGNPLHNNPKDD